MAFPTTDVKALDYGIGFSFGALSNFSLDNGPFATNVTTTTPPASPYNRVGQFLKPTDRLYPPFPTNRQYPIY